MKKLLMPTLERAALFTFFLTVIAFNFFQTCATTPQACDFQRYPLYIVLFALSSYGAACILVSIYEQSSHDTRRRHHRP